MDPKTRTEGTAHFAVRTEPADGELLPEGQSFSTDPFFRARHITQFINVSKHRTGDQKVTIPMVWMTWDGNMGK